MDITELDLTNYGGGIIFCYMPIGKLPPSKASQFIERERKNMQSIIKYLEDQGFVLMFIPSREPAEARWVIWGMNAPYRPSIYEQSTDEINLDVIARQPNGKSRRIIDVVAQAQEAMKRRLDYKGD